MTDKEVKKRCTDCIYIREMKDGNCKYFCIKYNKPCNEIKKCEYEE